MSPQAGGPNKARGTIGAGAGCGFKLGWVDDLGFMEVPGLMGQGPLESYVTWEPSDPQ